MMQLYILTLKQKATLHVAKLFGSAVLGAVAAMTFLYFFGGEAFFVTMLLIGTVYALREVYMIKVSELEYNEKLKEITDSMKK